MEAPTTADPDPTPADAPSEAWSLKQVLVVVLCWVGLVVRLGVTQSDAVRTGDLLDTDDYMRLAQIRDWVNGQSWWDRTQTRLDPPEGVALHFSRLGDVGVGLLVRLFQPFLGEVAAERVAIAVYPLALLGVAVALLAVISGRLGGPRARPIGPALLISVGMVLVQFAPGRIDHHGLQLVLVLALLCALVGEPTRRNGVLAGIAAALSVAVGMETAPYLVVGLAAVGLRWVLTGDAARRVALGFAAGLGLGVPALLALTVAPSGWVDGECTTLAAPHATGAMFAGLALAGLAAAPLLRHRGVKARLASLGGVGAVGGVGLVGLFPSCRKGAYGAMDIRVREIFLSALAEARSLPALLGDDPRGVIQLVTLTAVGLIVGGVVVVAVRNRSIDRWTWGTVTAFAGVGLLVTMWQVRGAYLAPALAAPIVAAAMQSGAERRVGRRLQLSHLGIAAAFLALFLPIQPFGAKMANAWSPANSASTATAAGPGSTGPVSTLSCTGPDALEPLADMDLGTIFAPVNVGPSLLVFTPHQVIGAPYHLRHPGLTDVVVASVATPNEAAAILARRDVDTVIACPNQPETRRFASLAPDGFVAQLSIGNAPEWLVPLPLPEGSPLLLYRVDKAALPGNAS